MSSQTIRKNVERVKYIDYRKVAESFYGGASVAKEYEYWNAAGVLIVHSAIALSDAITIKNGGVKCQGDDHLQVVKLLREILASSNENNKALVHLEKIIAHKTSVSYSGDVYNEKDIANLWKNFERYKLWADVLLDS